MSSWRMRGVLSNPAILVPPKPNEPPETPTLVEMIRFHVQQLIRLSEGKQGRVQMILTELRKARLAPRARKRK